MRRSYASAILTRSSILVARPGKAMRVDAQQLASYTVAPPAPTPVSSSLTRQSRSRAAASYDRRDVRTSRPRRSKHRPVAPRTSGADAAYTEAFAPASGESSTRPQSARSHGALNRSRSRMRSVATSPG
jgi:hypothetical protein